jgi:hypothetical protein
MSTGYILIEVSDPSVDGEYVYQAQIQAQRLPGATNVTAFSSKQWSDLRVQLQQFINIGDKLHSVVETQE